MTANSSPVPALKNDQLYVCMDHGARWELRIKEVSGWVNGDLQDLALMWSRALLPLGDSQHRVGQCCGEQDRGLRVVRCTLVKDTTRAESARGTPFQASQHHPLFTLCLCHQHGLL